MKKTINIALICTLILLGLSNISHAQPNKMNAAWITTVYNADWPHNKDNPNKQKQQMINTLDELKDTGIDTVMFQARIKSDALYKSNINPWSDVLTGTQGKNPGYDPLEFVIQQAHKRGMKVHAWLNPYRVTTYGTDLNVLADNNPAKQHPEWTLTHNNRIYLNPELPEVKKLINDTIAEVVTNYDVDGIHFDDYFYPTNYPLPEGQTKDSEVANERRNHINEMILSVKNTIKSIKPQVEYGISPRGIWKNNSTDLNGSDTRGKESYYCDYADTLTWIKNDYIDYVVPQIYWEIGLNVADYSKLVKWWSDNVKGTNTDLYIGQGIYKDVVANEIDKELNLNKQYPEIKGSIFYSTSDILNNRQGCKDKIKKVLTSKTDQMFKDVANNHWAKNEIEKFVRLGYINGNNEDNTFKPSVNITRADFIKLVNGTFNFTQTAPVTFTDTKDTNAPYYKDLQIAVKYGYINGYEDNTFRPNAPITRQEAMKIVTLLKNKTDKKIDKVYKFNDHKKVDKWAIEYVEGAIEAGYIKGDDKNNINPHGNITRAESVVFFNRLQ